MAQEASKQSVDTLRDTLSKQNVLVLWDFDWSLMNHNCDRYPFHCQWGKQNDKGLFRLALMRQNAKKDAASLGKAFVFTQFMNDLGWPSLFDKKHKFNIDNESMSFDDFEEMLGAMPMFEENLHITKTLYKMKNGIKNNTAVNCEQVIVSNANEVLCDIILSKRGLLKTGGNDEYPIFDSGNIYTNIGKWFADENRLFVKGFHNADNPHQCNFCEQNLCKGSVLYQNILSSQNDPFYKDRNENDTFDSRVSSTNSLRDIAMMDASPSLRQANKTDEIKAEDSQAGYIGDGEPNINNWFVGNKYNHIDRIVYVADGENDFCPISKLRDCDFGFVRKGFALDKFLQKNENRLKAINATIYKWEDGAELLSLFANAIPEIDWEMK